MTDRVGQQWSILPLAMITFYVKQVAEALQYAHDRRIIHRDIKPENMLLGPQEQVWLSDFGIAVAAHNPRSQVLRDEVGTVPYMAPEQLQGHPQPASDQYALGCVVYEWLSGVPPFSGSDLEIVAQHLHAPPPPLQRKDPAIPSGVEQVVLKALEKDPARRFSSVREFALTLEQAAQTVYRPGYAQDLSDSKSHSSVPFTGEVVAEASAVMNPMFLTTASGPVYLSYTHVYKQKEGRGQLMMEHQAQEQRERPPRRNIRLSLIIGGVVITIVLASTIAVTLHLGNSAPEAPRPTPTAKASTTPTPLFPPPGWQQVLNDSLVDNGNGYNWGIGGDSKQNCKFADGGILVSTADQLGRLCTNALPIFSNLAFEVQMTIVQGDEGGILLRSNLDAGDEYAFYISQEGTCEFNIGKKSNFSTPLYIRTCPAFHTGLNQTNLIAVVANGNIFDLFVNDQFVAAVTDRESSFSSGQIGFFADSRETNGSTQVLFKNAKVWTPPGS